LLDFVTDKGKKPSKFEKSHFSLKDSRLERHLFILVTHGLRRL